MESYTFAFLALIVLFGLFTYLNRTDDPRIKGLPEAPGVPIFGSLINMGQSHARAARKWVKSVGPVFQVRLGRRVSLHIVIAVPH